MTQELFDPETVSTRWMELPDAETGRPYRVNVTVRQADVKGEEIVKAAQESLLFWYCAARRISVGEFEETRPRYAARNHVLPLPRHGKAAVTIWGEVQTPDGRVVTLTMTERGTVQEALTLAKSMLGAEDATLMHILKNMKPEAKAAFESRRNASAAPTLVQPSQGGGQQPSGAGEGQQIFEIVKIKRGFNDEGVQYYGLFTMLRNGKVQQYPMTRIYADSKDYERMAGQLPDIKPGTEITGKWTFVADVVKKTGNDGKERTYYNPISLQDAG